MGALEFCLIWGGLTLGTAAVAAFVALAFRRR